MPDHVHIRRSSLAALRIALILGAATLAGCTPDPVVPPGHERVVINDRAFILKLANDDLARTHGLMGRSSIEADKGMLFVFPDAALRSFWMKNCLTDMDVIFLDARGTVTAVHHMTIESPRRAGESIPEYEDRLRRYLSLQPAQFAIELAPGTAGAIGVRVDQRVELDLPRLKAAAR